MHWLFHPTDRAHIVYVDFIKFYLVPLAYRKEKHIEKI
jgi:hypothetical protein